MKLVREPGDEAIADTSWSVVTGSGDRARHRRRLRPIANEAAAAAQVDEAD